ncbi:hypothetical protein GQ42DRAFT_152281 [Ramicandelaber brevisporus]|nr:hypothetical protein GQ42DRAFT_152281 [Ramicandelaber brevisporus]
MVSGPSPPACQDSGIALGYKAARPTNCFNALASFGRTTIQKHSAKLTAHHSRHTAHSSQLRLHQSSPPLNSKSPSAKSINTSNIQQQHPAMFFSKPGSSVFTAVGSSLPGFSAAELSGMMSKSTAHRPAKTHTTHKTHKTRSTRDSDALSTASTIVPVASRRRDVKPSPEKLLHTVIDYTGGAHMPYAGNL